MTSGISTLVLSPFHLLTWSLRRFSRTFLFLLSPFSIVIYYSSYVFVPLYGPVQMLPKLEAVYIFCGTAAVIGISVGCLLGLTNYLLFSAFGLTSPALEEAASTITASDTDSPQSIKQLRDDRRRRRQDRGKFQSHPPKAPPTPSPLKPKSIPTILEEEDEEEYGTTSPVESLGGRARNGLAPFTQREDMSDTDGDLGF